MSSRSLRPLLIPSVLSLLVLCAHAHAAPGARLSAEVVKQLAVAAAANADFNGNKFGPFPPKFDSVTRVWTVNFRSTSPSSPETFNVFVYDATSHTEVTCLGMSWDGAPLAMAEIPREVRPFVPSGESATNVLCGNLNDTGNAGYVLVTRKQNWDSASTLQGKRPTVYRLAALRVGG